MDENEIKQIRQSFTNPYREDLQKPHTNQFGHTILGDQKDHSTDRIEVKFNDFGEVIADPKDILDHPRMKSFIDTINGSVTQEQIEDPIIDSHQEEFPIKKVDYAELINELEKLEGPKEKQNILKPQVKTEINIHNEPDYISTDTNTKFKSCLNKECMYNLPKDAKFCLKCGTYQMPKFCTECGYSFPGMEKFCPDCGTQR